MMWLERLIHLTTTPLETRAIAAVIEEYFTSREEESEEFDSTGKNKYNR